MKRMEAIFESDWKKSEPVMEPDAVAAAFTLPAKKVAKEVMKQVSMKPAIEEALDKVIDAKDASFEPAEVAQTIREAVREEVQGAVVHAIRGLISQTQPDDDRPQASSGSNHLLRSK